MCSCPAAALTSSPLWSRSRTVTMSRGVDTPRPYFSFSGSLPAADQLTETTRLSLSIAPGCEQGLILPPTTTRTLLRRPVSSYLNRSMSISCTPITVYLAWCATGCQTFCEVWRCVRLALFWIHPKRNTSRVRLTKGTNYHRYFPSECAWSMRR